MILNSSINLEFSCNVLYIQKCKAPIFTTGVTCPLRSERLAVPPAHNYLFRPA
jgi:hypothetical protein